MATKKKTAKTTKKSKKTAGRKATRTSAAKRPKKLAKKKAVPKRTQKAKVASRKETRTRSQRPSATAFLRKRPASFSGELSGDLQGLSRREAADSESVDELLEEGNAFEAGTVMGVEDADSTDEREVHTREVPEDDVPGEYLDEE